MFERKKNLFIIITNNNSMEERKKRKRERKNNINTKRNRLATEATDINWLSVMIGWLRGV